MSSNATLICGAPRSAGVARVETATSRLGIAVKDDPSAVAKNARSVPRMGAVSTPSVPRMVAVSTPSVPRMAVIGIASRIISRRPPSCQSFNSNPVLSAIT